MLGDGLSAVTAVAAFGQTLCGDAYLGTFSFADVRALAGSPQGYWRQGCVKLTPLADKGRWTH